MLRREAAQSEPMPSLRVDGVPVGGSGVGMRRGEAARSEPVSSLLLDGALVSESGVPIWGDCVSGCLSDCRVSRAASKSDDSAGSDGAREPARRALLPLPAELAKVRWESSKADVTDSSSLGSGSRNARLGR